MTAPWVLSYSHMKRPPFSLAWPFLHRGWVWILPTEISDCNGILVKKRRMRFNLSRGSELTTLVKSTITTFQGPWPREGVTLDLIWASFMRTFLAPARWLNYQRGFLWEKSAGKSGVVYLSHCVEGKAAVTPDWWLSWEGSECWEAWDGSGQRRTQNQIISLSKMRSSLSISSVLFFFFKRHTLTKEKDKQTPQFVQNAPNCLN